MTFFFQSPGLDDMSIDEPEVEKHDRRPTSISNVHSIYEDIVKEKEQVKERENPENPKDDNDQLPKGRDKPKTTFNCFRVDCNDYFFIVSGCFGFIRGPEE